MLNAPFHFDIFVQLVNISARITLHELLHLSKEMREALKDALDDSELFHAQVPLISVDDGGAPCLQCHMVQQQTPCIPFTHGDMLLKNNRHDRPLYYTGYIGSTYIEVIQVDQGSAVNIIPRDFSIFSISL